MILWDFKISDVILLHINLDSISCNISSIISLLQVQMHYQYCICNDFLSCQHGCNALSTVH